MKSSKKIEAIAISAIIAILVFAGIMLAMAQDATTADEGTGTVVPGETYKAYTITYTNVSNSANLTWFNVSEMNQSINDIGNITYIINVSVYNATGVEPWNIFFNNTRYQEPPYFRVNLSNVTHLYPINSSPYALTVNLTINSTGLIDGKNVSINATLRSHNISRDFVEDHPANDTVPEKIEVLKATMGANDATAAQGQQFVMVANVTVDPGIGTASNLDAITFNITSNANMTAENNITHFALFNDSVDDDVFDPALDEKVATIASPTTLNASFSGLTSTIQAGATNRYFLTMNVSSAATVNTTANNMYQVEVFAQNITINEGTGNSSNTSYSGTLSIVATKYANNDPSLLDTANSTLTNVSLSAVANTTDKLMYRLEAKDSLNRLITNTDFNVASNRTQDTITPATLTTNATGVALFNVTSTLAGPLNITVTDPRNTNNSIFNTTGVFIAGTNYTLKWFGPDNSLTGVTTINQSVAIQDAQGNNVTWDTLEATAPFRLTASIISGSATITSSNPIVVDENNVSSSLTAVGLNYSATFDLINFTITDTTTETVTIRVTANRTLLAATKDITFQAGLTGLGVTANKSSMYANGGNDTILVTVQLKDSAGNDIQSSGVTVELGAYTDPALFNIGTTNNNTDATGQTTFLVNSTTKDGSDMLMATVTANPGGGTGQTGTSDTITLIPCFAVGTSNVVNSTATILANETSTITAMIKAFDGEAYAGKLVTFNLTPGDGTFADGTTLTTGTSDSNGNATAVVTSTNASTTLVINVTTVDENSVTQQVGNLQSIEVDPNMPAALDINPTKSKGLKNVPGTTETFTIQLRDAFANDNTTAVSPVLIITDNEALGNMSNATATVNNNLWNTTTNGQVSFVYRVNSTTEGTAHLAVTATNFTGVTDTITVTTSGPTGLNLTVNDTMPLVGEGVMATAQLTGPIGVIGIADVNITFTLRNPADSLIDSNSTVTDAAGIATYNFSQTTRGVYTIKAKNDDYGHEKTNTTTYVGNATQIWIAVNETSPQVNKAITVSAIFKDEIGFNSSSVNTDSLDVNFLADDSSFGTSAIINGVASATYTQSAAGAVTIDILYTNTSHPGWNGSTVATNSTTVTFVEEVIPGAPNITALSPTDITPANVTGESLTFSITVDQTVNVSWYLNESLLYTNTSVTEASYTNASAVVGVWNVSAIAENDNGTAMQTWMWTVTEEAVVGTTGDININEIMYNPPTAMGTDADYEWIELYNNDTAAIDMSGWTLDGSAISPATTMQSGDYLIIARNKTAFESNYTTVTCTIIDMPSLSLTNTEDTIDLKNSTAVEMDSVTYTSSLGANGNGKTLELNATGGWEESIDDRGTPGAENSVIGVVYDPADTNEDCEVDMGELMTAIGWWKAGTYPNYGMTELMTSIGRWKAGSYC